MKKKEKNLHNENIPEYILENIEKEKQFGIRINETKHELKTNPAYKDFFNQYNPTSIDSFIDHYALKKTRYLTYGQMLKENQENAFLRRQSEADERLWEIQRKKLFDIECQWRAEMVTIPEIEISLDFEFWEKNIENCPFLDPISQDEFLLYHDYLLSENFNDFDLDYTWMGYNEIKENLNDEESISPWFQYCDLHTGTGSLMLLPDLRGAKEEYYLEIWRKFNSVKNKAGKKSAYVKKENRPNLYGHDISNIEEFIRRFENGKLMEYFRLYEKELDESNDELEQAIATLKEADEIISIECSDDWKAAIIRTAHKFEQNKLAEACSQAYKQYLYRTNVGISHEIHHSEENIAWMKEWAQQVKDKIIQARVIKGEPPDLNF